MRVEGSTGAFAGQPNARPATTRPVVQLMGRPFIELAPGVWAATSRRYWTTSTALLDGSGDAIVVDPAWDPDELAAIPAFLAERGVRCVAGLATHEHYDHVLWHPDLGEVPRWASERTVVDLARDRERLLAPLAEFLTPDLIDIAGRLDVLAGDLVPWDGPTARVVRHDAHAPGHLAVLIEECGVLLAGDMLSDIELPMPADDDLTLDTYLAGLTSLADAVRVSSVVVPGHGTPSRRPIERLDADLRYLDDLLSGRISDDPRIGDPENAALHAANQARARRSRGDG